MSKKWSGLVVMGITWISDASAVTGNAFQVISSVPSSPISIELCLSAGTSRPNSQSGCETFTVNGSALAIQTTTGGRNGQGYSNLGIKILSSGYTVDTATPNMNIQYNSTTGYYSFPGGSATTAVIYMKPTTALTIGQSYGGGKVACLNEELNNLIAAEQDNNGGAPIEWGGLNSATGAQSTTDGASNTQQIVKCLTNQRGCPDGPPGSSIPANTYAAGVCSEYAVYADGTPCTPGRPGCYDDWFLPAGNNATTAGQLNCLFTNSAAIGGFANAYYWSSTENTDFPQYLVWLQDFYVGSQSQVDKNNPLRVRCVRGFKQSKSQMLRQV